jgi:hypothetical protein
MEYGKHQKLNLLVSEIVKLSFFLLEKSAFF